MPPSSSSWNPSPTFALSLVFIVSAVAYLGYLAFLPEAAYKKKASDLSNAIDADIAQAVSFSQHVARALPVPFAGDLFKSGVATIIHAFHHDAQKTLVQAAMDPNAHRADIVSGVIGFYAGRAALFAATSLCFAVIPGIIVLGARRFLVPPPDNSSAMPSSSPASPSTDSASFGYDLRGPQVVPMALKMPRVSHSAAVAPVRKVLANNEIVSPTCDALLEIMAATPDTPASESSHMNTDGGLIRHTQFVLDLILQNPQLLNKLHGAVTAIAHDIGKIECYEKQNDAWMDKHLLHDTISAHILMSLPEFWSEFDQNDAQAIALAVKCHHSKGDIPRNFSPYPLALVKILRAADNSAASDEVRRAGELVASLSHLIPQAVAAAIPNLNINRILGGQADGWTHASDEFTGIVVKIDRLRTLVTKELPQPAKNLLIVRSGSPQRHPLWISIAEHLRSFAPISKPSLNAQGAINRVYVNDVLSVEECTAIPASAMPTETYDLWLNRGEHAEIAFFMPSADAPGEESHPVPFPPHSHPKKTHSDAGPKKPRPKSGKRFGGPKK